MFWDIQRQKFPAGVGNVLLIVGGWTFVLETEGVNKTIQSFLMLASPLLDTLYFIDN